MAFTLRRQLSLVHLLGAAACLAVLGHTAAGWVAGRIPGAPPPRLPAWPAAAAKTAPSPEAIAARNVFCSTCAPHAAQAPVVDSSPRRTRLPLVLVAVNHVGRRGRAARSCTLRHARSQEVGLFALGARVHGATITAIHDRRVDLEIDGRPEYLDFTPADPASSEPPTSEVAARPAPRDPLAEALQHGLRQTGPTSYELDRAALELVLANLARLATVARFLPATEGGRPVGFRALDVRPGSPLARAGLASGDVVTAINGLELTSIEQGMALYLKLKSASHLELSLQRGGRRSTLTYAIR
jgi:general secretion pathway protein C